MGERHGETYKKNQSVSEIFEDCPYVDWVSVNGILPTDQDPAARSARKELFQKMDLDGLKRVNLKEAQEGLHDLLGFGIPATSMIPKCKNLKLIVKTSFHLACKLAPKATKTKQKEKNNNTVDRKEFHAFLVAFKFHLEIAEFFQALDDLNEDDELLSHRECMKRLPKFAEWGITEEEVAEEFKDAKFPSTPYMPFKKFLDWVIGQRVTNWGFLKLDDSDCDEVVVEAGRACMKSSVGILESLGSKSAVNTEYINEAFAKWDADGSGGVDHEELSAVMMELNPKLTPANMKLLFKAADVNNDGVIDYQEFIAWMFHQ